MRTLKTAVHHAKSESGEGITQKKQQFARAKHVEIKIAPQVTNYEIEHFQKFSRILYVESMQTVIIIEFCKLFMI